MQANNLIEGNPTKKFFIGMITRDITIEDAIIDLLDNSIDGANRINSEDYSGLVINITINDSEFIIEDNCGGFSLETAQKYAFRFGRPEEAPNEKNTIGRFGIGMKRSLFKIGKNFEVESQTKEDHFKVIVDVDQWSKQQQNVIDANGNSIIIDDWSFKYHNVVERNIENGTRIVVNALQEEVRDLFKDDGFLNELIDNIQKQLNFSLLKGITIKLNNRLLEGKQITMLVSNDVKPYIAEGNYDNVKYRLIAGLGKIGNPKESGWYIFCNNRLVVDADTSPLTGWGVNGVSRWHISDVMYRGVLFLEAEDTINLPLTTTKKGIDATSNIYQAIIPIMRQAMIQVLNFLKKIPDMKDSANDYRKMLCETLDSIDTVEMKTSEFEGVQRNLFIAPKLDMDLIAQKKNAVRIAYDADRGLADAAKEYASVPSYKELGLTTFNYYIHSEEINGDE